MNMETTTQGYLATRVNGEQLLVLFAHPDMRPSQICKGALVKIDGTTYTLESTYTAGVHDFVGYALKAQVTE